MAMVLAIEISEVVRHKRATLHLGVERVHEHLSGKLDPHATDNLPAKDTGTTGSSGHHATSS
eukprot:2527064-Heterocapsa_arctica.AAC.1